MTVLRMSSANTQKISVVREQSLLDVGLITMCFVFR